MDDLVEGLLNKLFSKEAPKSFVRFLARIIRIILILFAMLMMSASWMATSAIQVFALVCISFLALAAAMFYSKD